MDDKTYCKLHLEAKTPQAKFLWIPENTRAPLASTTTALSIAMECTDGSPVAPVDASGFMGHLEEGAIKSKPNAPYISYGFLENILAPTRPLCPSQIELSLKGRITTDIHCKPTANGQYLNFLSHRLRGYTRNGIKILG